jgi:hypothetical protein
MKDLKNKEPNAPFTTNDAPSFTTTAMISALNDGYTLVTLPRIVTPYRESVDGTRDRVTYQRLVTR